MIEKVLDFPNRVLGLVNKKSGVEKSRVVAVKRWDYAA
jgi:hypothetical protein